MQVLFLLHEEGFVLELEFLLIPLEMVLSLLLVLRKLKLHILLELLCLILLPLLRDMLELSYIMSGVLIAGDLFRLAHLTFHLVINLDFVVLELSRNIVVQDFVLSVEVSLQTISEAIYLKLKSEKELLLCHLQTLSMALP